MNLNPFDILRKRLKNSVVINPEAERQALEVLSKNRLSSYIKHGLGTSSIGAVSGLTAENLKRLVEGKDIDLDEDMLRAGLIGAGIGGGVAAATAPVKALIANKASVPLEIRKSLLDFAQSNPIRGGIIMKAPPTKKALEAMDSGIQLASNAVRRINNFGDDVAMMLPLATVPAASWTRASNNENEKTASVIAHIAGPSGSGKTTLLGEIKARSPNLVVKDLDDFDHEARKLPEFHGKKRDWDLNKLERLHKHRQNSINDFVVKNSDKSIVFGGHHIEGPNVTEFPAENRYLLNTGPITSAWRRRKRSKGSSSQRTLLDFFKDIREARSDISILTEAGYKKMSPSAIIDRVSGDSK